jgi:phosphopantothenoylcysteine decarboxylase/phosphopantothenate--cysteine ligase
MSKLLLNNKVIVVGITGGIAAYKIPELVHKLKYNGANVFVVMTENAKKFVSPYTLQILSQNNVLIDLFEYDTKILHIDLANKADIIIVAPATANVIGKVAAGIADNLLTTMIISAKCPILFVPSMNENMYKNKIVQENITKLKKKKYYFMEPEKGPLACGKEGIGRMPEIDDIFKKILSILKCQN